MRLYNSAAAVKIPEAASLLEMEPKLLAFATRTGLRFNDYKLLMEAMTHSSFPLKDDETTGRYQLLG